MKKVGADTQPHITEKIEYLPLDDRELWCINMHRNSQNREKQIRISNIIVNANNYN